MTNKRSRILSIILAVALLMSAFPIALPALTASAEGDTQSFLQSPDPGVSVTCTELTWVSAGLNSFSPGTSIVAATPSGIPAIDNSATNGAYYGETAAATAIVARFTNEPTTIPQITCTSGGSNVVFTTPAVTAYGSTGKQYVWTIVSGTAEPETVLEFSITYPFNGRNYVNKAYSFVRAVSQPAGIYAGRTLKTNSGVLDIDFSDPVALYAAIQTWGWDQVQNYWRDSKRYSLDFCSVILGRNMYYSLGDFYSSGIELCRASYNIANKSIATTNSSDFNMIASLKAMTTSGSSFNSAEFFSAVPRADVYIDTSVSSSLAGMNVKVVTNNIVSGFIDNYGENLGAQLISVGTGGLSSTHSGNAYYPSDGILQTPVTRSWLPEASTKERIDTITNTDIPTGTHRITAQSLSFTENGSVHFGVEGYIDLGVHSVDKGALRTTINKILAGTLYEGADSDPFNAFKCKNKGVNPQQWQFKNNWSSYNSAMRDARGVLLNPRATQDEIDGAVESLVNAYDNLQFKVADYSTYNVYKDLAEAAIAKEAAFYEEHNEHWFVPETLEALENALYAVNESCHILYQPQVDLWTDALVAAYNALEVEDADYTSLNAAVERANGYLNQTLADGSSIYVNPTDLAKAVSAVRYGLTKEDQDLIEMYEKNINDAIAGLILRPADYTRQNILKSQAETLKRSNYTNYNTVIAVLKDISKRANLKITQQNIVDADTAALQAALDGLIAKPANYVELEQLLAQAAGLVREYYTPETLSAVDAAVAAADGYEDIDILNQSRIDTLTANLKTALAGLVMYDADYTAVDSAIYRWQIIPETEKEKFQEASIQAVTVAISAVVRELKVDRQAEIDEWAIRINNAIDNIEYLGADYTRVNAAVERANALDRTYYADFSGVDAVIAGINWDLGLDRQADVDAYVGEIQDAIDQLVPGPADYSRVNMAIARFEALNKNYYTDESVQAVEELINNINWDLNKDNQATVITYAFDINEAIFGLVEADADYTEVERVIAAIPSNLNSLYTAESIQALNSIITGIDWTLKARYQSTVDGYVVAINKAVENLVYLPGDYSEVDRQIAIGREIIETGVLQSDGTYFEISARSAAEFEEFVANIDRSYNITQVEDIERIEESVIEQYSSFSYAESINRAEIKITTDKAVTYPGDVVTVSVSMKTDYYAAAAAIPVLYNSAYYDIVGNGSAAFTFSDIPYVNGATVGGNTSSPAKGYPASYSSADKATWKYAYITIAPSSDNGQNAVVIDPEQVVATFQLRVKDNLTIGNDPLSSRIWVDSAFKKTENNKGGKLYVGRYPSEIMGTEIIGFGQTINLTNATQAVRIYDENASAILDALTAALARQTTYDESFYTDESYEAYSDALAAGQQIADNAAQYTIKNQATVDTAVENINAAYSSLVLKDSDVSPIEDALLLTPEYTEDKYTQASYLAYSTAVSTAQAILGEEGLTIVDNERINAAAQAIEDALDALTLKDCSYLDDLYEILDTFPMFDDDDYDADAINDYYDAYDACNLFLAEDKTILDDEEALGLINDFNEKLVILELSALSKAIDDCTTEYDSSCYTDETYASYETAYIAAVALLESVSTKDDIAEIQDCVQTLKTRFAALEIKPFDYEDEVWAALDLFPQDEEHTVADSLDAYYEAYDALDLFASEKSGTWTAFDNAEALELINALIYAYEHLVIEGADVSELLAALNNVPEYDELYYTVNSYSAYAQAVTAGRALTNVTYDRQDDVDAATQAIIDAFEALELKPFSKLDDVNAALEAQPTYAQEKYIESYWTAYAQALADLNDIVTNADSLTIVDDQDAVTKIAAYNTALEALEADGIIPDADYSGVEAAITNANAKLAEMVATGNELIQSTVDALTAAIADVDYTLNGLSQDTIDAYAAAINAAADALEYVAKIVVDSEDVTIEDGFIFGLTDVASEEDILAIFSAVGSANVVVTPSDNGYGTGTVVRLVDSETSEVIEELVVVVSADANGDGFVDAFDVALITDLVNNFEDPSDEATLLALDVFADGWLDTTDLAYVMYMANYE